MPTRSAADCSPRNGQDRAFDAVVGPLRIGEMRGGGSVRVIVVVEYWVDIVDELGLPVVQPAVAAAMVERTATLIRQRFIAIDRTPSARQNPHSVQCSGEGDQYV
jgi:hypothetical protein